MYFVDVKVIRGEGEDNIGPLNCIDYRACNRCLHYEHYVSNFMCAICHSNTGVQKNDHIRHVCLQSNSHHEEIKVNEPKTYTFRHASISLRILNAHLVQDDY